jgi:hypothetical protein
MVLDPTSTFRCVLACSAWKRPILPEIYLRRACSYQEILRVRLVRRARCVVLTATH